MTMPLNPAPRTQAVPGRYTYNTVEQFKAAVATTRTAAQLTALRTSLTKGSTGEYSGVHPFVSGSSDFITCWRAVVDHGNLKGWLYDTSYKAYIAPARA